MNVAIEHDPTSIQLAECISIAVSPLMRELALALADVDTHVYCEETRGMMVPMLAQLIANARRATAFFVHQPRDPRLARVVAQLSQNPGDNTEIGLLAEMAHTSERTLARLFLRETGMTFRRWRERLRIVNAVDRLARGASITQTAFELGYQNTSSFTTMFTRTLGSPPSRYMRDR